MIVWGFRSGNKVMGQIQYPCQYCHNNSFHTIVRTRRWFTLFFIPTIPIRTEFISRCNICGFQTSVPDGQVKAWFPAGAVS